MPPCPSFVRVKRDGATRRTSDSEDALGVQVRDFLSIGRADWELIEERARSRHRLVGMVRREHDSIDADFEKQIEKSGSEIEAAECVVDILAKIEANRMLQLRERHG